MRLLVKIKDNFLKLYALIKSLDEMPMRGFQGEFYEEKNSEAPAPRKNKVKVEDLRPKS